MVALDVRKVSFTDTKSLRVQKHTETTGLTYGGFTDTKSLRVQKQES